MRNMEEKWNAGIARVAGADSRMALLALLVYDVWLQFIQRHVADALPSDGARRCRRLLQPLLAGDGG